MSILLQGDCLELMETLDDESVDLIFCDLPYGQTSCKWDCCIDLDKFWIEVMRIKKLNTPIFMTTTTKFGLSLLNSCPKKCPFRYDIVWVKSAPAGFLSAKKMPMRKHEMIYVFYEKLPFYDLSSHTHKFVKERNTAQKNGKIYEGEGDKKIMEGKYDPPLPVSVVKEETGGATGEETYCTDKDKEYETCYGGINIPKHPGAGARWEPPLPVSMLEIKSTKGKHSTEKPVALMSWILKYFSKEGDVVLDPTMGSGSTGVSCKEMNRNFIGIEKDPEIYQVAVDRIEN
jgi:DNA modification methylase